MCLLPFLTIASFASVSASVHVPAPTSTLSVEMSSLTVKVASSTVPPLSSELPPTPSVPFGIVLASHAAGPQIVPSMTANGTEVQESYCCLVVVAGRGEEPNESNEAAGGYRVA